MAFITHDGWVCTHEAPSDPGWYFVVCWQNNRPFVSNPTRFFPGSIHDGAWPANATGYRQIEIPEVPAALDD